MTALTDEQRSFLAEPNYGVVTTLRPDGSPHSTVVWVDPDGSPHSTVVWVDVDADGSPSFNTALGRVKPANLEEDPRVSLLVVGGGDFYRWLSLDGRVELSTRGAREQIDRLSRKYDGEPWQYRDGEERVTARILPERITTYGL